MQRGWGTRPLHGRALIAALVVALAGGGTIAAPAHARSSPAAEPPTRGALYHDGQSGRYLLGGRWLYRPDPAAAGVADRFWRDTPSTAGWSAVTIPNVYNLGDFSDRSFQGTVGWYRRDFTLPRNAFARYVPGSARRWIVRFESINYRATVWLNGHELGGHIAPNLPFELDLEGLRGGVNRLVVEVDSRRFLSDLRPGPGNGWWNYGGILREVYLRAVQRADVAQVNVQTQLGCPRCAATIVAQVAVRNPTHRVQAVRLRGSYGGAALRFGAARVRAGGTWLARARVRIARPRLWSPTHPALYHVALALSDTSNRSLAGYSLNSEIRTLKVAEGSLLLHCRTLRLRAA